MQILKGGRRRQDSSEHGCRRKLRVRHLTVPKIQRIRRKRREAAKICSDECDAQLLRKVGLPQVYEVSATSRNVNCKQASFTVARACNFDRRVLHLAESLDETLDGAFTQVRNELRGRPSQFTRRPRS